MNDIRQIWEAILSDLAYARQYAVMSDMRSRFGTEEEAREIEVSATIAWVRAKSSYCHNKEDMDKEFSKRKDSLSESKIQDFNAMKKVIEDEIATQLEEQILKEET